MIQEIQQAIGTDVETQGLVLNYTEAIIVVVINWIFVQLLRQMAFYRLSDYYMKLATIVSVFAISAGLTIILRQDVWLGLQYSILYSGLTIGTNSGLFGVAPPKIREFMDRVLK